MSFVNFEPSPTAAGMKTKRWGVFSNVKLGGVGWYAPWRRYVFWPMVGSLFDPECLREIAAFCEERTREHKAGVA